MMTPTISCDRSDAAWMARAAVLARKAEGWTSPNPPVGAIVVANGRSVGMGYHRKAGLPHAERLALDHAGDRARGATLYVTLEPCCHTGRTGPCTDAIIQAGIRRVVGGVRDPNPLVNGRGFAILKSSDIDVTEGVQTGICSDLIAPHRINITKQRPFFHLKLALSFDGRIAPPGDGDYWLTGEPARRYAHRLRQRYDAVLVGIETVIADDPQLNVRYRTAGARQPHVIVLDSRGRLPDDAAIIRHGRQHREIIVLHTRHMPPKHIRRFEKHGITTILVDESEYGHISIPVASEALWSHGIHSVLVEGGGRVASSFMRSGLLDRISFIIAPMLLGKDGVSAFPDLVVRGFSEKISMRITNARKAGKDLLIESTVME